MSRARVLTTGFKISRTAGLKIGRGTKAMFNTKPVKIVGTSAAAGTGVWTFGKLAPAGIRAVGDAAGDSARSISTGVTDPFVQLPGKLIKETFSPFDPDGGDNSGVGFLIVAGLAGVALVAVLASGRTAAPRPTPARAKSGGGKKR